MVPKRGSSFIIIPHLEDFSTQCSWFCLFLRNSFSTEVSMTICGSAPIDTCGEGAGEDGELVPVCCLGRSPHPPSLAVIPALYYLPYNCVCNKEGEGGEIKSIIIENCSQWPHTHTPPPPPPTPPPPSHHSSSSSSYTSVMERRSKA